MRSAVRLLLVLCALCWIAHEARADQVRVVVGVRAGHGKALVQRHGGHVNRLLEGAIAATVPASAVSELRADPDVAYVQEDTVVEAFGKNGKGGGPKKGGGSTSQPPQTTPWGITRVGAPVSGNTGSGVKVAVIDTGIDLTHPDLQANVKGAVDFVKSTGNDDNGHGSHVAGTIAAVQNSIGVVGVAPEASLYAVKVLDRRGSGWASDVAAGITWAADNGMNVANMSLGSSASSSAIQSACDAAEAAGVLLVAAAGNSGDGSTTTTEISYPAAYDSVVAVGATDSSDDLASFSNTGSFVEVSGPGVSVYSTYKNAGYATLSGTSMATPHTTGVAALLWAASSSPTVGTVRAALDLTVDDEGPAGRDNGYGFGIVDYAKAP